MPESKTTCVYVKGMHCPSCDVLVKDMFEKLPNVKSVKANYRTQEAIVEYKGHLDTAKVNKDLAQYGYEITDKNSAQEVEPMSKRLLDVATIGGLLFILFYFAKEFNFLPEFGAISQITYTSAFILGLVASTSSCMATSGALFMTTIGNTRVETEDSKLSSSLFPAISFNLGRVLSYGFFGFLTGLLGKGIAQSSQQGEWLSLFVAVTMLLIGLDMLKLLPFSANFTAGLNKRIFGWLEKPLLRYPRRTSLLLGASTYFLPCGFTQSVQIYALGLANPWQSAGLMLMFALGTVPALLALAFASSFTQSFTKGYYAKVVGVFVLIVGFSSVATFLSLRGVRISFLDTTSQPILNNILVKNGVQVATMTANNKGYSPNSFTVKAGVPVKWVINGEAIYGCQGVLVSPKIAVNKTLAQGQNVIEFTPKEKGVIPFSCTMGMYTGQFVVI